MQARRFHSIIRHHVLSSPPSTISRHAQLVVAHHHKHHLTITPATHRFIHTFHQRSLWNQQQQQQQQQQTTTTHDESVTTTSDSIQNNNNNGNAFIITTKEQQRANPNGILHEDFRFMIPMEDQLNAIRSGERVGPYDKHFLNLTNGLEMVHELEDFERQLQEQQSGHTNNTEQNNNKSFSISLNDMQFVRMQSTHLEANRYDSFLEELDHNLLMHLAMGYRCYIYDYGSRKMDSMIGQARALWQGILWTRFALNRMWLNRLTDEDPVYYLDPEQKSSRNTDFYPDFRRQIVPCLSQNKVLRRRVKYYAKFVNADAMPHGIRLFGVFKYTTKDGNESFYVDCAKRYHERAGAAAEAAAVTSRHIPSVHHLVQANSE